MDVSITAAGTQTLPAAPPVEPVAPVARRAQRVDTAEPTEVHSSRLSALVDLIQSLTGREVKLVPPSAYLMSKSDVATPPIEVVAPIGLIDQLGEGSGAIEIGIDSIMRTGTSQRMLLDADTQGVLRLRAGDLEL